MPKLNVTVAHQLGQAEAASRLSGFMRAIKSKYGDQIKIIEEDFGETSGVFAFKTMGQTIKGNVAVEEDSVSVDCDLPFTVAMFKGRIEKEMRENLERALR